MDIEGMNTPVAGKHFSFRVTGGTRPTFIEAFIDRTQVIDSECADPPCHDMIFIPHEARGAEILIIARDTLGNIEQRMFQVRDYDASAGGTMAVAG